ncbi:MAG TPA: CRISPR-associated helicase Cas3' [Verrucomicrobiae bacterium]|nr:CRISPR-associated helicase Cas3' [Verrucomicrobiae bacterium]
MKYFAHTNDNGDWQPLDEHLRNVADLAAEFARPLGIEDEVHTAGLLHDLGKYRDEFQAYLRHERASGQDTQHAVYGAAWAGEHNLTASAFSVAGHHAGLHDLSDLQGMLTNPKRHFAQVVPEITRRFEAELGPMPALPKPPPWVNEIGLPAECYTRMLFSCIVDADRLDTAYWPAKPPPEKPVEAERLLSLVLGERDRKRAANPGSTLSNPRNQIFDACLDRAVSDQGFFSLTVPTGGGKTLSAMAFALAHAKRHGLRRVIVVIPYLSIIEQNAAEYRRVFGDEVVLEHHSAAEPPPDQNEEEKSRLDLATENWNAPVIVTTSVQFLESLLAASPSRCRKLHRIARSVVIFDEVQTLPAHLLQPVFSMFRELQKNYGVSFVFSSATQPAFRRSPSLPDGFTSDEMCEIVPAPSELFHSLRRVNYHLPKADESLGWPQVAEKLAKPTQVLCVVNLVRHASELWQQLRRKLPDDAKPVHLSAAMCPQHRLDLLAYIRACLLNLRPCRVISTQLIEAGVDVDFPEVWRALGPLDSIVQVAGRCNREARLQAGEMHVFRPVEHKLPGDTYRVAADLTATTLAGLGDNEAAAERLATDAHLFGDYFNALWQSVHVGSDIQDERKKFHFRTVATEAKVIKDVGQPVIVPYSAGKAIVEEIRNRIPVAGQSRFTPDEFRDYMRGLQRFMVNVQPHNFMRLQCLKAVSKLLPNLELYVLDAGYYHADLGLIIENRPMEDLVGV